MIIASPETIKRLRYLRLSGAVSLLPPKKAVSLPDGRGRKCPNCGSTKYALMPTDFETAKCSSCSKLWDIKAYSPDEARDDKGRWTDGGYELVSPNEEENLDFEKAVSNLKSQGQTRLLKLGESIDRQLGVEAEQYSAIGDWSDGAENSIVRHVQADPDTIRYSAALMGDAANQKAVIAFSASADGPDSFYRITLPGIGLQRARKALDEAGIQFRTLIPGKHGTDVAVLDQGNELSDKMEGISEKYNAIVERARGTGEFIGADTREEAHHAYQSVIQAYEKSHSRRYQRSVSGRAERIYNRRRRRSEAQALRAYSPDEPRDEKGKWTDGGGSNSIPKSEYPLTGAQRAAETKFRNEVARDPEAFKVEYRRQFGNVLNADNAKELSEEYRKDRANNAVAVHEPASWLVKEMYKEELAKDPAPGKSNLVFFTAGGAGSGKTTSIARVGAAQSIADEAHIVYDGTLRPAGSAMKKIDQALAAGKNVVIGYIDRPADEALVHGVLPRAMRIGRTLPIAEMAQQYSSVRDSMKAIRDRYAKDNRVAMFVISNPDGPQHVKMTSLDQLPASRDDDYENLHDRLNHLLDREYRNGAITEPIYRATKGVQEAGPHKEIGV